MVKLKKELLMIKPTNKDEVIKAIKYKIVDIGREEFLALSGCNSSAFLSNVLSGRKQPSQGILDIIGYEVKFVKAEQS